MTKIAIKSEKLTPFGGIFPIMDKFESTLSPVIDSTQKRRPGGRLFILEGSDGRSHEHIYGGSAGRSIFHWGYNAENPVRLASDRVSYIHYFLILSAMIIAFYY